LFLTPAAKTLDVEAVLVKTLPQPELFELPLETFEPFWQPVVRGDQGRFSNARIQLFIWSGLGLFGHHHKHALQDFQQPNSINPDS
jgi:hypothetical protein